VTVIDHPVVVDDTTAWPAVLALIECLCTEMVNAGLGPLCLCSPLPGAQVAMDYGDQGMAWVRVEGVWPSVSFPNPEPGGRGSCTSPLAIQLEVGAARCAPALGPDGELPSLADQFDATRMQLADMSAMHRAISCCQGLGPGRLALGTYTPGGPQGGVLWGTWTVWVEEGWGRGNG
jgi:hypothetical protein